MACMENVNGVCECSCILRTQTEAEYILIAVLLQRGALKCAVDVPSVSFQYLTL